MNGYNRKELMHNYMYIFYISHFLMNIHTNKLMFLYYNSLCYSTRNA